MKWYMIFLALSLLFISSFQTTNDNNLLPCPTTSILGTVAGNDLSAEMCMFPGKDTIRSTDPISLKYRLTNNNDKTLTGTISVEDTPDTTQFGGIQEPAQSEFLVGYGGQGGSNTQDIVIPGTTNIVYKNGLNTTSFVTTIKYSVDKEADTNQMCIRYSSVSDVSNCPLEGSVQSNSALVGPINYKMESTEQDNLVNRITLTFDINDKCEMTTDDQTLIQNSDVYLKNSLTSFECHVNQQGETASHKSIVCTNRDTLNLDPNNPSYKEGIVVKFKYDCKLLLDSGFITFNKGG